MGLRWAVNAQRGSVFNLQHSTKGNMADYFTNFSVVINLASKKQQAYALDLADKASHRSPRRAIA